MRSSNSVQSIICPIGTVQQRACEDHQFSEWLGTIKLGERRPFSASYGFGFDASRGDYSVVQFSPDSRSRGGGTVEKTTEAKLFHLRNDSSLWDPQLPGLFPNHIKLAYSSFVKFLKGVLYWIASSITPSTMVEIQSKNHTITPTIRVRSRCEPIQHSNGEFLIDVLYWLATRSNTYGGSDRVILGLDLHHRRWSDPVIIEILDLHDCRWNDPVIVGILKLHLIGDPCLEIVSKRLCILSRTQSDCVQIWEMEDGTDH
ncbi:hypothetical protein Dimus_012471 [Dionaea muscipula]